VTCPLRPGRGGLLLSLRVTPGAAQDEVGGLHTAEDGAVSLIVKVTAAPDKGRANKAVIESLAKACRLPKSAFALVSGETSRSKTVMVSGDGAAVEALVAARMNGSKEQ
jgi:uncharacterized protein (TIGR00251 family)